MKNKIAYFALVLAAAALASPLVLPKSNTDHAAKTETAYERVLRTNTLRCGYAVFAPYFIKDPATGKFNGIWHDFTEAVADHLGLKVVWAEEVGLGDIGIALDTNKIDAYCGGLWTAGKRVRVADFLKPSAFEPMLVYVRMNDHRFDNDLQAINDPAIGVSTIDGEGGGLVAAEEFPRARMVSLPQLSNYADMFNQVATKKADVLLSAPSGAEVFMKNNPGTLRPITDKPVRIFPVALAVKYGESALRDMLNQAQEDIIYNGKMDKILSTYEPFPNAFMRIAPLYIAQTRQ